MSKSCCENKASELDQLRNGQKNVLFAVLFINTAMFFIEFVFGLISRSSALTADSLDMLGDSVVYGFSLYVLNKGVAWRAKAGFLKGVVMAAFGLFVLTQTAYRFLQGVPPTAETMGVIGGLALAANLVCLVLLFRHRGDDINMRSTWLCSRNDIISNVGVLMASGLVAVTHSIWPDTVVGIAIAGLFLKSAITIISESRRELKMAKGIGISGQ